MRIKRIIFYHPLHKTGAEVVLTIGTIMRNCFELNEIIIPKTSCVCFIKIKFPSEFLGRKCLPLFVPSWQSNSHAFSITGPCLYAAYMLFCFLGLMLKWANHIKLLVGNTASLKTKCTKWQNNMLDLQTGCDCLRSICLFFCSYLLKKKVYGGPKGLIIF